MYIGKPLNFDPDPNDEAEILALIEDSLGMSDAALKPRLDDTRRLYDTYYMQLDRKNDDPYAINVRVGKAHSYIEQLSAKVVKNLFGQTPHLPLAPEDKDWRRNVEAMETTLDRESRRWNHFHTYVKGTKLASIAGMAGLRANWRVDTKNVTKKVARRRGGYTTGYDYIKQETIEEGLELNYIPLWAMGWDPYQDRRRDMRFFFEKYPISRDAVIRQVNAGLWERNGKKVTVKDLKEKNVYASGGIGNKLLSALQLDNRLNDEGMCMLIRFFMPGSMRLIVTLDCESIIGDYVLDGSREELIDIVPFIYTEEAWPQTLLGQSPLMPIENLSHHIDDSLANQLRMGSQEYGQVWMYLGEAFPNVNALYPGGGSRIMVSKDTLDELGMTPADMQNLIQPIQQTARGNGFQYTDGMLERYFNEAIRMNQVSRGSEASGDRTMYEIRKMTEATDEGIALMLKTLESGLELLAHQAYRKLGENITENMARFYLGKDYRYFIHKTPEDIPGGAFARLRGGSMLAGKEADQNARMADLQVLQPFASPTAMQALMKVYVGDATHWPSDAKDEFFKELEDQQKQQEQQAAMGPQGEPGAPGAPGQPVPGQILEANKQPQAPVAA